MRGGPTRPTGVVGPDGGLKVVNRPGARVFGIAGRRSLDGVERITLGTRVLGVVPMTVHCYRIGATLVDAGPPNRVGQLVDLIDEADPDGIDDVVLTHHHEDHVGAAARLAENGARVHAPEASIPLLDAPPGIEPYQRRVWGSPEPVEAIPVGDRVETADVTLEVHPAAGHSPDHVLYLAPEQGWLFAGDAYLPPRETLRADEDLAGYLSSLERMRDLDATLLLPGHGSLVDEPTRAIGEVLEHFDALHAEAHALHEAGHAPAGVRRRLLGLEGFIRYYTGGHYAKQNLVDELLALER